MIVCECLNQELCMTLVRGRAALMCLQCEAWVVVDA